MHDGLLTILQKLLSCPAKWNFQVGKYDIDTVDNARLLLSIDGNGLQLIMIQKCNFARAEESKKKTKTRALRTWFQHNY